MEPEIPVLTGLYAMPAMVPAMMPILGDAAAAATTDTALPETSRQVLAEQGFTTGLIEAIENNCKRAFANSIWVVDNSGSMQTQDGQRIIISNNNHHNKTTTTTNNSNYKFIQSTRWAEMQQTVDYHAQLAALLEFPTTFRLLNDPGRVAGPQIFTVATLDDLPTAQTTMEQAQPAGVTPLTRHLREIRDAVRAVEDSLRQRGQRITITLATDGTPTDERGCVDEMSKQVRFYSCLQYGKSQTLLALTRTRTLFYGSNSWPPCEIWKVCRFGLSSVCAPTVKRLCGFGTSSTKIWNYHWKYWVCNMLLSLFFGWFIICCFVLRLTPANTTNNRRLCGRSDRSARAQPMAQVRTLHFVFRRSFYLMCWAFPVTLNGSRLIRPSWHFHQQLRSAVASYA
jgi:hypothetical protein